MSAPLISEFVFYEAVSQDNVVNNTGAAISAWFHPVGYRVTSKHGSWGYAFKCHDCNKLLCQSFKNSVLLFIDSIEEQKKRGVTFYSVYDGDTSYQYCKTCIEIQEIAPKL